MTYPAIVVIAYNRIDALRRLLTSLKEADYPEGVSIPLIISIDKGENAGVIMTAEKFEWTHGEKTVIQRNENLGLKKHVITCGNLVNDFEKIIVLEDDLYVSPAFYHYAVDALFFTEGEEKIAGVSLYDHRLNVHVREPFMAYNDGYDNYYFQFASSWGQAFDKEKWNGFTEWMKTNDGKDLRASNMPENVSSWSDKSWLKYFIKYMIETDKYFLYPNGSYTTNFADEGTNEKVAVNDFQVPMIRAKHRKYCFSKLSESSAVYDAFFENTVLSKMFEDTEIDLYGYKPVGKKRYLLSSKSLPYKITQSFARRLRPLDANIFDKLQGEEIFLYDTDKEGTPPDPREAEKVLYNYRALNAKKMMKVLSFRVFGK